MKYSIFIMLKKLTSIKLAAQNSSGSHLWTGLKDPRSDREFDSKFLMMDFMIELQFYLILIRHPLTFLASIAFMLDIKKIDAEEGWLELDEVKLPAIWWLIAFKNSFPT